MKIIVSIKQVPARDSILRVHVSAKSLDESGLAYEMNGPDAYALEAALKLRDKLGGEVAVLSAGPERVTRTIREALAKGADRGIHVLTSETQFPDPFTVASAISAAVRMETPDLFLTGLQSEDVCSGETGVIVAELLGFAHATIVTEVEVMQSQVRVKRELEGGWHQYVTLPLPAVLTMQSGSQKPRLATMIGIKKAKTKEIRVVTPANPHIENFFTLTTERIHAPARENKSKILTGDARECARKLVEQLRFEAHVL